MVEGAFSKLPDFASYKVGTGKGKGAEKWAALSSVVREGVVGSLSLVELGATGGLEATNAAASTTAGVGGAGAGAEGSTDSGTAAAGAGGGTVRKINDFAVQYEAIVQVPVSGSYTFYVGSNDGSKIIVDGGTVRVFRQKSTLEECH